MIFKQLNPQGYCKTYLIASEKTNEAVIIDPVYDNVEKYEKLIKDEGYELTYIIDTHTHADHITGAPYLSDKLDVSYLMSEKSPITCASRILKDGSTIEVNNLSFTFIATPGHTKDALSILVANKVLTGDALFIGSAGRTDLPGGDAGDLYDTMEKYKALPDSTEVWPAHDYNSLESSTIGQQKATNDRLQPPRTKEEFISYLESLRDKTPEWMVKVLESNYSCAQNPQSVWIPADATACEVKSKSNANSREITEITAVELRNWISRKVPLYLLDVRQPEEYTGGHIGGADLVPLPVLVKNIEEIKKKSAGKKVITICRSGSRSYSAASILGQAGLKNVYSLSGGMVSWGKKNP